MLAWLQRQQQRAAELRQYEYSPLVKIQGQSDVGPGTPLFEYLYVFENYPLETSVAASAGLIFWHMSAWKTVSENTQDAKQLEYYWRQFRRRMQCSAMLALLAIAIFIGLWITGPPILVVLYWSVVLLLTVWLALLAIADIIVTVHHFQDLHADNLVEQAKLKAEAKRIKSAVGNGRVED